MRTRARAVASFSISSQATHLKHFPQRTAVSECPGLACNSAFFWLPAKSRRIEREARFYSTSNELIPRGPSSLTTSTTETTNLLQKLLANETESSLMQKIYEVPEPSDPVLSRDVDFDRMLDLLTLPLQTVDPQSTLRKQEDNFDKFFATRVKTKENFRRLIQIQGAKKKYEDAVTTFGKMRGRFNVIDPHTYVSMIKVYADARQPWEAMKLFTEMGKKGIQRDIEAYGCIINAYTQSRNMPKALELFNHLKKSGLAPNIVVYTDIVHGYWNIREVDKMWETYEQMRLYDRIVPDQVMYTMMMRACAERCEVERAFNIFDEMQIAEMPPTSHTYNTLIYACAKRADYYKEAFITLEKMKSAGFVPDLATWNSILYASATVGDYEMAERTFQEMVNQRAFDGSDEGSKIATFVTLMKAYARGVGHETAAIGEAIIKRAYDHIKLLKEIGVQEDLRVLNSVLQLYAASKRIGTTLEFFFSTYNVKRYTAPPEGSEEGEELLSLDPAKPWELRVQEMSDARLSMLMLENGLSAMGSRREIEERAVTKAKARGHMVEGKEMSRLILAGKDPSVVPDIMSYNLLIKMFAETYRSDKALEVWRQIKEHNEALRYEGEPDRLVPDMHTYESMVKALAKGSYLNTAMKFMREMRAKGYIPSDNVVKLLKYQLKGYPDILEEVNRLVALPPGADLRPGSKYQESLTKQKKSLRHPLSQKDREHLDSFMMRL